MFSFDIKIYKFEAEHLVIGVLLYVMVYFISRYVIFRLIFRFLFHSLKNKNREYSEREKRIIRRASLFVPSLIVWLLVSSDCLLTLTIREIIQSSCSIVMILSFFLVINEILEGTLNKHEQNNHIGSHRSIKGYIQIAKIFNGSVAVILIIAILSNKSPVIVLSSLGAVAAVLMLIFQHTIISLVANIQVSSSNILRIGDWIQVPQYGIDGVVIDIALHTITLKNWDNTISRVPTKTFITENYINWRTMYELGGRRIKRTLFIDQSSIEFLSEKHKDLLNELTGRSHEMKVACEHIRMRINESNNHDMTNLGLFRDYIRQYLHSNERVKTDMTLLVRTLDAQPYGLPLEIYCFCSTTQWSWYEEISASLVEHIYAMAKFFGITIYQENGINYVTSVNVFKERQLRM
ncbi:mechanosensitive ion channel family protein [Pantoea sp. App145]|uniref:mechanosensitive ion channel family protein n=1 Tax=Pantoea sp. App145 TaxID=3071567 RepID=UPI003A7FB0D3